MATSGSFKSLEQSSKIPTARRQHNAALVPADCRVSATRLRKTAKRIPLHAKDAYHANSSVVVEKTAHSAELSRTRVSTSRHKQLPLAGSRGSSYGLLRDISAYHIDPRDLVCLLLPLT